MPICQCANAFVFSGAEQQTVGWITSNQQQLHQQQQVRLKNHLESDRYCLLENVLRLKVLSMLCHLQTMDNVVPVWNGGQEMLVWTPTTAKMEQWLRLSFLPLLLVTAVSVAHLMMTALQQLRRYVNAPSETHVILQNSAFRHQLT